MIYRYFLLVCGLFFHSLSRIFWKAEACNFNFLLINLFFYGPCFLKKRFYLFIFREKGRDGRREGEKHLSVASHKQSDWESNWWPFAMQDDTQLTEPHQTGQGSSFRCYTLKFGNSNYIYIMLLEVVPQLTNFLIFIFSVCFILNSCYRHVFKVLILKNNV